MKNNIFFHKDKLFLGAIVISLAWHLFWISVLNVTVSGSGSGSVKYSKVYFLGPLIDRGPLQTGFVARERGYLEKRAFERSRYQDPVTGLKNTAYVKPPDEYGARFQKEMAGFISDAIEGSKLSSSREYSI